MALPFSPFIRPGSGITGYSNWHQIIPFGGDLPNELAEGGNTISYYSHLELNDPTAAELFAAVGGKLSTRPPTGFLADSYDIPPPDEFVATGAGLTLYLEPNTDKLDANYKQELEFLLPACACSIDSLEKLKLNIDVLKCFVYINLDYQELKLILCPKLKTLGSRRSRTPQTCDENVWQSFLSGKAAINVQAGELIGKAGMPYLATGQANPRQVGFGVLTKYGPYDPGLFYQKISAQLPAADASLVSALVTSLLKIHWPLILNTSNPVTVGTDRTLPYSALLQYKNDAALSYGQWRALGDRQKKLFLGRLLRRVRPDLVTSLTVPRFEFNMDDTYNIFQLEAVIEFYINYSSPWDPNTDPILPDDQAYRRVNLLPLYGESASVNAKEVILDVDPGHELIIPGIERLVPHTSNFTIMFSGRDVITLDSDSGRKHKKYRILNFNPNQNSLTLDQAPQVSTTTAWRISPRPVLVGVDAFGSRVRGSRAVKVGPGRVNLENLSSEQMNHLKRVNERFDTISFSKVDASNFHEFRIEAVDLPSGGSSALLTLNADASLPAGGSPWRIPAGVGGMQGNINPPQQQADRALQTWDHYDGMMFVVLNGQVEGVFPWTSFTSRKPSPENTFSSIKGNRLYHITSILSRKDGINFSFEVSDEQSIEFGNLIRRGTTGSGRTYAEVDLQVLLTLARPATQRPNTAQWIYFVSATDLVTRAAIRNVDGVNNRLIVRDLDKSLVPTTPGALWLDLYDGVHEGGLFFDVPAGSDTAPTNKIPPFGPSGLGKGAIRLHAGGTKQGNGSLGCIVSPFFTQMRNLLIQHHLDELADFYESRAEAGEFRNLHTTTGSPPLFKHYKQYNAQLIEAKDQLKLMQEAFRELARVAEYDNSQAAKISTLTLVFESALAAWESDHSRGDLMPSSDLLEYFLEVFELLGDGEVQELLSQSVNSGELLGAEHVKQLKIKIARLESEINAINQLWNDRIQGFYWLIHPDEPPFA